MNTTQVSFKWLFGSCSFTKPCGQNGIDSRGTVLLVVGTFTLSNLGMFGVDRFDAILPPGQACVNIHFDFSGFL